MTPTKVIIKKYENRRLYDTAASRYVNLEEVAQMVREGVEVQVVDAATGEDITRLTLTQIIMDGAKGRDSVFPLDMLRHMIITSGASSQEAMLKYMKVALDMYQNAYRSFPPAVTPLEFMQNMMAPAAAPSDTEVTELRRRLEELEKRVAEAAQGKATRKKPKPRR